MAELDPDTVINRQSSLSSAVTSECVCIGNTEELNYCTKQTCCVNILHETVMFGLLLN